MLKSGLVLTLGNAAAALFGLARNILIARLVGIEDFGIASTFAITLSLIEMSSDVGLNRLIVQAHDGEKMSLQATIQSIQVVRGLLGATVLFLTARPIAVLFGIPDVQWAYELLALVPLLRGFAHFDMFRLQREMRFIPSVAVEISAQGTSTVAAVLFGLYFRDYRAMLYAILLQQLIYLIASHAVATRRYRLMRDRAILGRTATFGTPLLLNALLMFAVFQGDRIIVGNALGMEQLGWFSAAFALTLTPTLVLSKTLLSLTLPKLARVRDDNALFIIYHGRVSVLALMLGSSMSIIFLLIGPAMMTLIFGPKYAPALSIISWLGVMQSWRVAKLGPSVAAIAMGKTTNPLWANAVRFMFIPIAWLVATTGETTVYIIVGIATAGEFVSFCVSLILLQRTLSLEIRPLLAPLVGSFLVFLMAVADNSLALSTTHTEIASYVFRIAMIFTLLCAAYFSLPLRQWFGSYRR